MGRTSKQNEIEKTCTPAMHKEYERTKIMPALQACGEEETSK
jgi:hypothetical protein